MPGENANARALQILVARCLEEVCRKGVASIQDKRERGSLRKGAYYLARIIYLSQKEAIDKLISSASAQERKANVAHKLIAKVNELAGRTFDAARKVFVKALGDYLAENGGNEDAALKNSKFSESVDAAASLGTASRK
jgi:hypothetical protein